MMVLSMVQYQVHSVVHVVILKRDVIKIKQQALMNYVTIVLISSDRLFRFFRAQPIRTSNARLHRLHVTCPAVRRACSLGEGPAKPAVYCVSQPRDSLAEAGAVRRLLLLV